MDIRIDFFKKEKVIQILKTVGAALAPLLLLSLIFWAGYSFEKSKHLSNQESLEKLEHSEYIIKRVNSKIKGFDQQDNFADGVKKAVEFAEKEENVSFASGDHFHYAHVEDKSIIQRSKTYVTKNSFIAGIVITFAKGEKIAVLIDESDNRKVVISTIEPIKENNLEQYQSILRGLEKVLVLAALVVAFFIFKKFKEIFMYLLAIGAAYILFLSFNFLQEMGL